MPPLVKQPKPLIRRPANLLRPYAVVGGQITDIDRAFGADIASYFVKYHMSLFILIEGPLWSILEEALRPILYRVILLLPDARTLTNLPYRDAVAAIFFEGGFYQGGKLVHEVVIEKDDDGALNQKERIAEKFPHTLHISRVDDQGQLEFAVKLATWSAETGLKDLRDFADILWGWLNKDRDMHLRGAIMYWTAAISASTVKDDDG